jgi:hypothetical protein
MKNYTTVMNQVPLKSLFFLVCVAGFISSANAQFDMRDAPTSYHKNTAGALWQPRNSASANLRLGAIPTEAATVSVPNASNNATFAGTYFVDAAVSDKQTILDVLCESGTSNTKTFQLFTHGKPGELLINGKWLNKEEIANFIDQQLSSDNQQMTAINIYGCNFAKGTKGQQALAYIQNTTGLKVAASNNITGKDGDWDLELGNPTHPLKITNYGYNLQINEPAKCSEGHHAKAIQIKQLTCGQKLEMAKLADAVTWTIKGPSGTISGKGNALNDYVFDTVGDYEIAIQENIIRKEGQCNHSTVPNFIQLRVVHAVKMTFHPEELKLSDEIRKGVDTRGIVLSITVTIENVSNLSLDYIYLEASTSGLGTHIVATLKKGTVLKEGKQVLEYELTGVAEKEAYIQFNFTDINGQVQIAVPKNPVL